MPNNPISEWPPPDYLTEKWRYVTLEPLQRGLSANKARHTINEVIQKSYENNMFKISEKLAEALSRVSSQGMQADIRNILAAASSLALDLGIQRARIQIFSPQPGE